MMKETLLVEEGARVPAPVRSGKGRMVAVALMVVAVVAVTAVVSVSVDRASRGGQASPSSSTERFAVIRETMSSAADEVAAARTFTLMEDHGSYEVYRIDSSSEHHHGGVRLTVPGSRVHYDAEMLGDLAVGHYKAEGSQLRVTLTDEASGQSLQVSPLSVSVVDGETVVRPDAVLASPSFPSNVVVGGRFLVDDAATVEFVARVMGPVHAAILSSPGVMSSGVVRPQINIWACMGCAGAALGEAACDGFDIGSLGTLTPACIAWMLSVGGSCGECAASL